MPDWMEVRDTNGVFENDVCRVLSGEIEEVVSRRMGEIDVLQKELRSLGESEWGRSQELYATLRKLRDELNCLKAIA